MQWVSDINSNTNLLVCVSVHSPTPATLQPVLALPGEPVMHPVLSSVIQGTSSFHSSHPDLTSSRNLFESFRCNRQFDKVPQSQTASVLLNNTYLCSKHTKSEYFIFPPDCHQLITVWLFLYPLFSLSFSKFPLLFRFHSVKSLMQPLIFVYA